jgi:hypothetical protein
MQSMRWAFAKDDDGHWFLIPAKWRDEFNQLLESDVDKFNDKFSSYATGGGIYDYSFTNVRYDD